MVNRQALIAKIHIAKKAALRCTECGRIHYDEFCPDCGSEIPKVLSDEEYRGTLGMLTGFSSCAEMDEPALQVVGDFFDRCGFKEAYPYVSPAAERKKQRRHVLWNIRRVAPEVLGENWESRVEGFVRNRIGKATLEWCDEEELRKVIGWVNRIRKYRS